MRDEVFKKSMVDTTVETFVIVGPNLAKSPGFIDEFLSVGPRNVANREGMTHLSITVAVDSRNHDNVQRIVGTVLV